MHEGTNLPHFASFAAVPAASGVMTRARRALLDLLFPPRCVICRQTGSAFCPACLSRVQPAQEEAPSDPETAGSVRLSGIRSAGLYRPPLSLAIREFKYRRRTDLAASLSGLMAHTWQSSGVGVDLVAAVPLHEKRLAERGYNQAELLAVEFCRAVKLPHLSPGLLARQKSTEHQVGLGLQERRRNVEGAFVWNGPPLQGATVLLIDDVATTGSTLDACAEALLQAGAGALWALTAARAVVKSGHDRLADGPIP